LGWRSDLAHRSDADSAAVAYEDIPDVQLASGSHVHFDAAGREAEDFKVLKVQQRGLA
jgi:hypothetical protein